MVGLKNRRMSGEARRRVLAYGRLMGVSRVLPGIGSPAAVRRPSLGLGVNDSPRRGIHSPSTKGGLVRGGVLS